MCFAWPCRGHIRPKGACAEPDRKSTRLNSSHANISYAVFRLKKKNQTNHALSYTPNPTRTMLRRLALSRKELNQSGCNHEIPFPLDTLFKIDDAWTRCEH